MSSACQCWNEKKGEEEKGVKGKENVRVRVGTCYSDEAGLDFQ